MAAALDPPWQDLDRAVGQMLIMGWDGTEITPQIRSLIVDHGLGSILLTAKNLKSAQQTALLVQELQTIAHQAGHPVPLLIALDQENGGVNSLFDEDYVCQFPSAMGIAATGRAELAYQVNKATAAELGACGINLMLGPVLDVLSNARYQPLGVRAASDDPQEVSQYGIAAMDGIKDAGLASCGKHFPSYGNLDFLGSTLDMPIITQTLEELSLSALVPFRNSVATGKLDAMFVGGCGISNPSMNVNHACLSDQVVDDLLRNELGFEGVAISECLEMEALSHDIGVANGVIMAVNAGCDLVLLCRAYSIQLEAVKALKLGYENGNFSKERIYTSLKRVLALKAKCTDWERALNPPGISLLSKLHPSHLALSRKAYDESVTIIRDRDKLLPLTQSMLQDEDLLLLTPLVNPLPASALTKSRLQAKDAQNTAPTNHDRWVHRDRGAIMSGEGVFRELGRSLARGRHGKLLHTSYTPTSVRPLHENLINRASCIIIVTADANRNLYQTGFVKHVDMMCSMLRSRGQKKSLIVIAVSSPYDFAMDKQIGTYVCTFDFTETAMKALVRALLGEFKPQGTLPGTLRKSKKVLNRRQPWLVEEYDRERDATGLEELLKVVARSSTPEHHFLEDATAASFQLFSRSIHEAHYVVRNSSTHALYGFAATYFVGGTGILGAIFVDPTKRNVSIGRSLHRRAIRSLLKRPGCTKLQLGTGYPGIFLGLPSPLGASPDAGSELRRWFRACGWDTDFPRRLTNLVVHNVAGWSAPEGLLQSVQRANFRFDLVQGIDSGPGVLGHIGANAGPDVVELYAFALQDPSCGVVRVKGPDDSLLGTVIECKQGGSLSTFIPSLRDQSGGGGSDDIPGGVSGIVAPVVAASAMASAQGTLILQGLALMGIRRHKTRKAAKTVLSWVLDDTYEHLLTMGFEVAQTFDQVTNSADNFSEMA